jgi:hypothetical protein
MGIKYLEEALTAPEAAALWGLDDSTVKKACQAGRFEPHEARKTGKVWLITRSGMERVYGQRAAALQNKEEN